METALPDPPAEAVLIRSLREKPGPRSMSKRDAAKKAGISEAWWRAIENGYRHFRGRPYPERGNAKMVAKMACVVGAVPGQLSEAGRPDAAAELDALLVEIAQSDLTAAQRRFVAEKTREINGKLSQV